MTESKKTRPGLSREKIVERAIELADQDGFDALSMRALAGSFGTTAMSLYKHVGKKDALLQQMLNQISSEIVSPDPDGKWEPMLRRRAESMRQVLLRHPWAMPRMISTIALGDEIMRDVNATLACLHHAGFSYAQADWIRNAVDSHVYGYVTQELGMPVQPEAYREAAAQYLPMISTEFVHVRAATQEIIDGTYDGLTSFQFGLDLLLQGIHRWSA